MTNSNKSVFIDQKTSHIKHGWQAKRMIMEYNACVSCALIGHNFPNVVQVIVKERHETIMGYKPRERVALEWFIPIIVELLVL